LTTSIRSKGAKTYSEMRHYLNDLRRPPPPAPLDDAVDDDMVIVANHETDGADPVRSDPVIEHQLSGSVAGIDIVYDEEEDADAVHKVPFPPQQVQGDPRCLSPRAQHRAHLRSISDLTGLKLFDSEQWLQRGRHSLDLSPIAGHGPPDLKRSSSPSSMSVLSDVTESADIAAHSAMDSYPTFTADNSNVHRLSSRMSSLRMPSLYGADTMNRIHRYIQSDLRAQLGADAVIEVEVDDEKENGNGLEIRVHGAKSGDGDGDGNGDGHRRSMRRSKVRFSLFSSSAQSAASDQNLTARDSKPFRGGNDLPPPLDELDSKRDVEPRTKREMEPGSVDWTKREKKRESVEVQRARKMKKKRGRSRKTKEGSVRKKGAKSK